MKLFAPHITDGYKLGHPSQYAQGTDFITSNFTPRDFGYAPSTPETKTDKMVFVGLQYAVKEYLINMWNDSFFSQPKEKVLSKYARRIKNYMGSGQAIASQKLMSDLHDLGFLPIKIAALNEGSRVNPGIPVFVITNTIKGFGPLVNYLETILSDTVWPMCNSASLIEQYYLLAKSYGLQTGASAEFWLPFAVHNFAMRGHRGVEDAIISAFGHSLFSKGTDTFAVVDFIEEYYSGDSDVEFIAGSVNASEHATVCQQIAVNGGGHDGEVAALKYFLTSVYPTGIFSYVSDSRDYWDVIANISSELKDIIISRGPNENGQPGVLTFRPDSSKKTPYEVILGDEFSEDEHEVKGTLQLLWDIFGGTLETGSDGKQYKLLDSHVRVIYGEAISLKMGNEIYQGMKNAGWCVGNVFFGVGSWSFIGNSSRDSYGIACKATNSVVNGLEVPLQKDPKGTSTFKKSARGRLMVIKENDLYVLKDNVTEEQEATGELIPYFINGKIINEQKYSDIVARLV
jgi:nicotinamide phosphoribosyltransferase